MFQPGDIVKLTEPNVIGIVESITVHDTMTVYFVRSIYTGDLYSRELEDGIVMADDDAAAQMVQDAKYLTPVVPETVVLKSYPTALLTTGMVMAEIQRTETAPRAPLSAGGHSWIIGVNASSNMFA